LVRQAHHDPTECTRNARRNQEEIKKNWRSGGLNAGPSAIHALCKADALPLSHIPITDVDEENSKLDKIYT
jgi:hypothetical protein